MSCSGFHRTASDARLDKWLEKMRGDAAERSERKAWRRVFPSLMVADEEVDLIDSVVRVKMNKMFLVSGGARALTTTSTTLRPAVWWLLPLLWQSEPTGLGFYHLWATRETSLRLCRCWGVCRAGRGAVAGQKAHDAFQLATLCKFAQTQDAAAGRA